MVFLVVIGSFLVGAIPFALIISRIFYKTDIRQHGSGNPGASNTLRTLGVKAGIIVLLLDMLKGFLPVFIADNWTFVIGHWSWLPCAAGFAAVLGHVYSPFLKFKGGKGVATAVGAMLALEPVFALLAIAAFLIMVFSTRYASLSSLTACAVFALLILLFHYNMWPEIVFADVITLLIVLKHRSNIIRLWRGEENKLSLGKKKE